MQTERIDLGDGDYAVLKKELTHRTSVLIQELVRQSIPDDTLKAVKDVTEAQGLAGKLDNAKLENIILLNQITEWSFGSVNEQSLGEIFESKYIKLREQAVRMYETPFFSTAKSS